MTGRAIPSAWARFRHAWDRYWFEPGGELSAAVVRIALMTSILMSWALAVPDSYEGFFRTRINPELYRPIGVLQLFGSRLPPPEFFEIFKWVALGSSLAALVGWLTRASLPLSIFANLVIVSLSYSWGIDWWKGFNVVLLGGLAFAFTPCAARLSVDAWWRRRRGKPVVLQSCRWGVYLGQFAVGLMFLNAAYWKWTSDPIGLGWVRSDTLRNLLLERFLWQGRDLPGYISFVASHEALWKLLGAGNMISQTLPFFASFATRRPLLRAALGAFFLLELAGLGVVTHLWEFHWIPLYAFFVDWDAVRDRIRPDSRRGWTDPAIEPTVPAKRRLLVNLYVVVFLGYYAAVAFYPWYGGFQEQHRSYPFTKFPMYGAILAKKPYSQHQTWEWEGQGFEVREPTTEIHDLDRLLQRTFFNRWVVEDVDEVVSNLRLYRTFLEKDLGVVRYGELRWNRIVWQAPAYPAPPGLTPLFQGLVGRIDGERYRAAQSLLGRDAHGPYIECTTRGYTNPSCEFAYVRGLLDGPHRLVGRWQGKRLYFDPLPPQTYNFLLTVREPGLPQGDVFLGRRARIDSGH